MISNKEDINYYKMILDLRKEFESKHPHFVKSVFIYGSTSRGEMIPGLSDLDVMVILKKDFLKENETKILNSINKSVYSKHPIHMTFRLRSPKELSEDASTTNDFGPLGIWEYYTDAWYVYGADITDELVTKMQRSSTLVENDLREKTLELRKNFRSLYSVHDFQPSSETTPDNDNGLQYKIGDILCELSKIVCWAYGERFFSTNDAISKAAKLTNLKVFRKTLKIKQSKTNIDEFKVYGEIEKLFHKLLGKKTKKAINLFKNQRFKTRNVVGAILKNKSSRKYLLLKRSTISGYWTIPKGGTKSNESHIAALRRELFEETKITKFKVTGKILPIYHTYLNEKHILTKVKTNIYVAETTETAVTLSNEHSEFKWVNKKQFLNLSKHKINLLVSLSMV